ncbi:hypothetical protein ACFL3H_02495 [Gemmatimonadota bacterium]
MDILPGQGDVPSVSLRYLDVVFEEKGRTILTGTDNKQTNNPIRDLSPVWDGNPDLPLK